MTHLPADAERRRAIDDLFDRALEQPPDQRAAWLNAHCTDAQLCEEVEALLRAHDLSEGILDQDALKPVIAMLGASPIDRQIGPYRVLRELGRGGMGVVYLADRVDGQYRSRVAIKLLRSSPDAEELHRRFVAERQILASLNHPNIAQLLDGGITDDHLPYLVMEYVDGVPLTKYCDSQKLSIEERLRLFHDVCAAVHHAHQNLVIHRDIKPGNILVTHDRRVKLLDFGIAKLINPMLGPADQPFTRTEWRVMTPEYASPEQMRGDSLTTASDVYALGVVLFELLCGHRPYRLARGGGSAHELAAIISEREPELPSVALTRAPARSDEAASVDTATTIAAARGLSVDRLRRLLRDDLDAIVMMALRKESARRYGSAELLWEDLQRHLDGLPVIADRGTPWYRARKFLGRHRIEAAAAAVVIASLVTGATVAVRQAAVAGRERDRAELALDQSTEVTDFLVRLFRTPAPAGAARDEVTARDLLATGTARVDELADQPLVQAHMLDALGRVHEQLGRFEDSERLLRRALGLRRAQHGDDHADVARSLNNLAAVIRQRGRPDEALQLYREARALQERVLGQTHPEVALTIIKQADLTSNDAEAESLFRAARAIQRAAFGPEHIEITSTNLALSDVYRRRGDYANAEALLRENLAIRERLLGPEHPATATSMTSLANLLISYRGQPVEAESLYNRALGILRRQPARYLPNLVGVLSGLIGLSDDRGDYGRAEALAREALDAQRRTWGRDHPMSTEPMGMLAVQLANQRRYVEAESIHVEALAMLERTLGAQHGRIGRGLIPLARVRSAMGRRDAAEADLRRALAISEVSQGPQDRWVGAIAGLLGELVAKRGASAEADALFERSASILRSLPLQAEADIRAAYSALADHYRAKKQSADEEYFRRLAQRR